MQADTIGKDKNLLSVEDAVHMQKSRTGNYRNDLKFLDRQVWVNSADPLQSDQGLHCLQFCLHLLEALLYDKALLFKF